MKTIKQIALEVANEMGANAMCKDPVGFAAKVNAAWLAQQEPVAWVDTVTSPRPRCITNLDYRSVTEAESGVEYVPLFLAPTPAKQKPVAWRFVQNGYTHYTDDKRDWYDATGIEEVTPLYELPAQGEKP